MKISAVGAPPKPVYGNLPNKPAFGNYGTFSGNNYTPSGGSSSLPGGGMKPTPIPGFPGSGGGTGNGANYTTNYSGYQQPPWLQSYSNTQSAEYGKPQDYSAVNVPQWKPDNIDYVGQAYSALSNTGGLQGLYDNIYKNTQRLDPYGSGLSSAAATQEMMNASLPYVMNYAGQLSSQGFQGGMQNVQNQYGANINAQNLTANSYGNAMNNYAQQQANLANMAQGQYQWGQNFGANQAAQDQAQANWQAQFDRQEDWYNDAQKISNKPNAGGGGGTNFIGGMPSFGFPAGAGGLPGSPSSSNPWEPYSGGLGGGIGQWNPGGGFNDGWGGGLQSDYGGGFTQPWSSGGLVPSWASGGM